MLPHLGVNAQQKKPKAGTNRNFQAKLAKYKKLHIIETTTSILTKFCTMTKTTKYSSWMVQTRVQRIQDGGRQPF